MFVQFLIVATVIIIGGPIENEGGRQAVMEKGFEQSAKQAWRERKPVDYSKLNN